ncbi:MAG TPA: universal stress protein [Flavipsychrobacter sp.]|nr:universal stress protein [Flavipsychrobacter sp.]
MPVIITATDFSDVADKAVNYACRFAGEHGASVTVLHSYIVPVTFSDTPMPAMPIEDGRQIAETSMNTYISKLVGSFPDIEITGKVIYGDIIDTLEEYTEEEKPWLIILGNNQEDSLWLGSTVLSALRHLHYPVVAIPPDAVYRPVKKICLACDYTHITSAFPTQQLLDLVINTKAELHVLNINYTSDADPAVKQESKELHALLDSAQPEFHFVDNPKIDEAIQQFVESNHMDWLVVIPQKHSFFDGLFHKSHTKAMIQMSHIPLIALHNNE